MKDMARRRIIEASASGPAVAEAQTVERGFSPPVQPVEDLAISPDSDRTPAKGPVFEDF